MLDTLFSAGGTLAMLGWALLVLAPRRPPVLIATGLVIPALLAVPYAGLIMTNFADAAGQGGGYGSLTEVRALLASDEMLLAGWIHYLSFDLAVGTLLAVRLDAAGIGRVIQAPFLLAVFLFGPAGFLAGLITEGATRHLSRRKADA